MGRVGGGKRESPIKGQAQEPQLADDGYILFSFRHLDQTQAHTMQEWHDLGLLPQMFETFRNYSTQKMASAFSKRFKCYGGMPDQCEYGHPRFVPEDAKWTTMHLQGKPCVIGHIVRNIFYVVFLDGDHRFYPTDLQDR